MNAIRASLPSVASTRPAGPRSSRGIELGELRNSKSLDKPSAQLARHGTKGSSVDSVEIDLKGSDSNTSGYVQHTFEARVPLPTGKGTATPTNPNVPPTPGGGSSSGTTIDAEA
ncbi:MAG: hypothetical protein H8E66_26155 [Planctomycetes bacterium]|nr:hypothetical protein [Planctomycetota bacterium]